MDNECSIAVQDQQAPLTLLEETNPTLIINEATEIANALADIIEQKKLYTVIKGKKHVHVEGWTTLGALLKVFPILDTSKRLDRNEEIIYESRIVAKTLKGDIVGIGEALCSDKETVKRKDGTTYQKWDDEYAIKSMSITRATSKSLRIPLGWIMVLAGYEGTPAEEMDGVRNQENNKFGSGPARTSKKTPKSANKKTPKSSTIKQEDGSELETPKKEDSKPPEMDMVPLWKKCSGLNKEFDQIINSFDNKDEHWTQEELLKRSTSLTKAKRMTHEEFSNIKEVLGIVN
jgi:hypothetical protein